jgi:hypothetical protein
MTPNPLAAIAGALGVALLVTIAAAIYTEHRSRRTLALLRRQTRRELADALAAQPPLPTQLRLGHDRLIIVARVRRPRNN